MGCIANLLCAFMGKPNWHYKSDQRLASWNRKDSLVIHYGSYHLSFTKCPRCCSVFAAFSEDTDWKVQLEDIPVPALVVASKFSALLLYLSSKTYSHSHYELRKEYKWSGFLSLHFIVFDTQSSPSWPLFL